MQKRRLVRTRLWVEELEPRVVLSTTLPLATVSSNWAGYVVQSNLNTPANNVVSAVSGSWTVPAVTGSPGTTAYSAVWVGLDGYTSNTVEQIGTESDWNNGVPTYYAWYEMYPRNSVTVTKLTVNPNDAVSASVTFAAGKFDLAITDTTTKQTFSTAQTIVGADRSSAEWIVEAPSTGFGVLPLANFASTTISNASATATIKGKTTTGGIDNPAWQAASINLVGGTNTAQASTGALTDSAAKSTFAVAYTAPATTVSTTPPQHHHSWWWSVNNGEGEMAVMLIGVPNANPALTQSAVQALPAGASTAPNVPHVPALEFRPFGLGYEAPPVADDVEAPMPRMPAPVPNREAPPVVIPPAPPGETAFIVAPVADSASAPAPITPDVPSERREPHVGDTGKALLAAFGVAGIVAFGGEKSLEKDTSKSEDKRKPRTL